MNSCAFDVLHLKQVPSQLQAAPTPRNSFVLEEAVNVKLDSGYSRVLKKGTSWNFVGMTSYGDVFRTKDQILTVEASNIHEAYIVVSSGKLVGFYLPVEKSFSPLRESQELMIKELAPTQ
jgi:hypothetical protein